MVRTIKIGDKSYDLKSSAFTMFAYKNKTGRDMLTDLNSINDRYIVIEKEDENKKESLWMKEITSVIDIIFELTYIMIKEQTPSFKEYDEWLKELDGLLDDTQWISDVIEVGISPFRGRLQNAPNK